MQSGSHMHSSSGFLFGNVLMSSDQSTGNNLADLNKIVTLVYGLRLGLLVTSLVFVFFSIVTWSCLWYKRAPCPYHRYVSFLIIFTVAFIYYVITVVKATVTESTKVLQFMNHHVVPICDHVMIYALLSYVILTAFSVITKTVTLKQIAASIAFSLLLAITLNIVSHELLHSHVGKSRSSAMLGTNLPKLIVVCVVLVLNGAILYCILGNRRLSLSRNSREFRVLRHGFGCLTALLLYCIVCESLDVYMMIHVGAYKIRVVTGLWKAGKGIIFSAFLCCFDLEILSLCKVCPLEEQYDAIDTTSAESPRNTEIPQDIEDGATNTNTNGIGTTSI